MIFLIEYDRPTGLIVELKAFDDSQRSAAENNRLELELTLNRIGIDHEVMLLEATSEEALRRTHQRYFATISEIAKSTGPSTNQ